MLETIFLLSSILTAVNILLLVYWLGRKRTPTVTSLPQYSPPVQQAHTLQQYIPRDEKWPRLQQPKDASFVDDTHTTTHPHYEQPQAQYPNDF